MIRSLAATLFALVMMGGLAVSAQADSIPTSGTITGNSTFTVTANPCLCVFDSNFTGSGVDTLSGNFTSTNMGTLIFSSPTMFTSSGTFIDVFAGGTVFGTFTETGTATGATTSTSTLDTMITGGTGMFAGETGESIVIGTNDTTKSPMFTGTYTGFITTPEPSSLALMLAGIGLLPLMRKRLAQGRQAT
ncbi:MAG TPA: PEP-CTERM sorting domain-containing protein [Candidatus Acidoferrum sp.]|jgi:hypothetical protein|nr:PEP-CTERM sorting domain-containing protein [Candidatus Acidoferrum sp.]